MTHWLLEDAIKSETQFLHVVLAGSKKCVEPQSQKKYKSMLKRFTRNGPNSSLQIDDNKKIVSTPDGKIDQSKTYFRQSLSCLTIIQLNLQKNTNSGSFHQWGLVLLLFFSSSLFYGQLNLENFQKKRKFFKQVVSVFKLKVRWVFCI